MGDRRTDLILVLRACDSRSTDVASPSPKTRRQQHAASPSSCVLHSRAPSYMSVHAQLATHGGPQPRGTRQL